MFLYDKAIAVVDIETTDAALAKSRGGPPDPIEVAVVVLDAEFEIVSRWESLVCPEHLDEVTEFTTNLTGITQEMLKDAPFWCEVWKGMAEATKYNHIKPVSWGAPFDYEVLQNIYRRHLIGWPHAYPWLDGISMLYWMASGLGLRFEGWKLKHACNYFSVEVEDDHRAMSGATACALVLQAASRFEENGF